LKVEGLTSKVFVLILQSVMKRLQKVIGVVLLSGSCLAAEPPSVGPGFADLAVLLAKGWFSSYVPQNASLAECAVFLNSQGICFDLFDLMDSSVPETQEDFARVIGQAQLLLSGEAERTNGCIRRPLEAETWVDYCLLNDIPAASLWDGFLRRMGEGSLPEVTTFFNR
jgi:hypothetical protein